MSDNVVESLIAALAGGSVEVVDLTQPLNERTPVIQLPEPFVNTPGLKAHEISRYDDRGPAWAWRWLEIGEHVGTHLDAPIHWISGRDGRDVSSIPPQHLVAPAIVIDKSAESERNPDYLLTVDDVRAFEDEHGPLPEGGWLLFRTGWDARAHDEEAFLNASSGQPQSPGIDAGCARWLAEERAARRGRRGDRRHRRGRRRGLRPSVPGPLLHARSRQVRRHPASQPRLAAADRRAPRGRPAKADGRHRQPGSRSRAGIA